MAKKDPVKFKEFYVEFNYFLKEGICHDYQFQDQIAKVE
jgi:HSP90 family molecular chaperone